MARATISRGLTIGAAVALAVLVAGCGSRSLPERIVAERTIIGSIVEPTAAQAARRQPVAMAFTSPSRGLIAMKGGGLLGTDDGGRTWQQAAASVGLVRLWASAKGYLGTTVDGQLVASTDGRDWRRVAGFRPPPGGASLVGALDVRHLWAAGPRPDYVTGWQPAAYATADGGGRWREVRLPCESHWALAFASAQRAYVACGRVGGAGNQLKRFFVSGDGGRTWTRTRSDPPSFGYVDRLVAASGRIFLIARRLGYYVSPNQGRSWRSGLVADDADVIADLSWPSPARGYALFEHSGLVRSDDGGKTWHQVYPPLAWAPGAVVSFSSAQKGIGVGFADGIEFRAAAILRTTDGGVRWRASSRVPAAAAVGRLLRTGARTVWAVGTNRRFLPSEGSRTLVDVSRDDGRTWASAGSFPGDFQLSMPDDSHGFLVERRTGRVLETTDGGRSWRRQRWRLRAAVQFVSKREGWALGEGPASRVLHTRNGGRTWDRLRVGVPGVRVFELGFLDAQHGWLLGNDCSELSSPESACRGAILRTSDGGRHWQHIYLPRVFGLGDGLGLEMATARVGYVEDAGGLFRTTDGGRSWRFVSGRFERGFFVGGW